jgi:hypothetical protein
LRGTLGELRSADIPARGEFVLVIGPGGLPAAHAAEAEAAAATRLADARLEVERLVDAGAARGDAAKRVAAATGLPRRALYGDPTSAGTSRR